MLLLVFKLRYLMSLRKFTRYEFADCNCWKVIDPCLLRTLLAQLTETSEGRGDPAQSAAIDSLGGGDVVSPGGHAVSLRDRGEDLLGSECQLDDARVYHGLSLVRRRCLGDHLDNKICIKN